MVYVCKDCDSKITIHLKEGPYTTGYVCDKCGLIPRSRALCVEPNAINGPKCNTRYCGHGYHRHHPVRGVCLVEECACCRWDGPEPNIETGRFAFEPQEPLVVLPQTAVEGTVTHADENTFTVKGVDGRTYWFSLSTT